MPMISLITPIYNAADTFERAAASVMAQTMRDFEWICVDDGSTDASREMLRRAAETDARVHPVSQKNGGAASARNRGLALAGGEYIAFLDADDWLEPRALERLLDAARRANADVVCCSYRYEYAGGAKADPPALFPDGAVYDRTEFRRTVYRRLLGGIGLNHVWHMLYRTDTVRGLQFDEALRTAEDLKFNVQALTRARRFVGIRDPLFHYTVRADSLTGNSLSWREKARCNRAVLAEIKALLPRWGMNTPSGWLAVWLRPGKILFSKAARMLRSRLKGCDR